MSEPVMQTTEGRVPQTVGKQLRVRKIWDIALSIVLLILADAAILFGAVFALIGVVAIASTCNVEVGDCVGRSSAGTPFAVGAVVALLALIGTAVTIVLLVRRRRGWWLAAATLVVVVIGWIVAFFLFAVTI